MARVFIFADQVKKTVSVGKKEIEIPEGARVSAAAADLIKDNKLKIKIAAAQKTAAAEKPRSENRPPASKTPAQPAEQTTTVARTTSGAEETNPSSGDVLSNEELEALVDRVVERFKQLKSIEPAASGEKPGAAAEPRHTAADDDLIICRCEEITKGEIKEAIRNGMHTLNGIKRITRAGMGLCQGQTCQRLVTQIIAEELGQSPAEIDPTTARGPVRPLRMAVFANR